MGDFFFIVKSLIITFVVVLLMQIKIGSKTVEHHSLAWMHDSALVENLRYVAGGAVLGVTKVVRYATATADHSVGALFGESTEGKGRSERVSNKARRDAEAEEGPNGPEID